MPSDVLSGTNGSKPEAKSSHVTASHYHDHVVLPKRNSLKCCQVASPHTQKKRRPRECGANRSSSLTSLTDNSSKQLDNRQLQPRHNTTTASKWVCEAYSNQLMRQMAVGSSWWYRKPPDRPRQHPPTVDPRLFDCRLRAPPRTGRNTGAWSRIK